MLGGVIFDMDGTLVNSEIVLRRVMSDLFEHLGMKVSDEDHMGIVGVPMHVTWAKFRELHGLPLSVDELLMLNEKRYFEEIERSGGLVLMPGVREFLEVLRAAKLPIGVATSAPREVMSRVLDLFDLKPYFEVLSSAEDVFLGKPSPDIFLRTAELMGVEPMDCVVFEDSTHGIAGAKAAKMKCIGYSNGGLNQQDLSRADLVLDSYVGLELEKLRELLDMS